jgi:hypothetical protein
MPNHNLESFLTKESREHYIHTPIWNLPNTEEFESLKLGDRMTHKRRLHTSKTPFGIGKVIELSIYPKNDFNFRFLKSGRVLPEWLVKMSSFIELRIEKEHWVLTPINPQHLDPATAELIIRTALFLYIDFVGLQETANQLDLTGEELAELLEKKTPLSYQTGIEIESLINTNEN